jgi:hypothetical protein
VSNMGEGPLARSSDLIIEELGDEVLVYDTENDRGHSLSPEAAKVWRACNGKTTAERLSVELGLERETVERALDELSTCELLETRPTIVADGSTRREVTIKMAKVGAAAGAAAAAGPLILSAAAPTPAMAASVRTCIKFSSGNCGGNSGCSKSIGCCCCVPVLHSPFPIGSPCALLEKTDNQCKTCVPCPGSGSAIPGANCTDYEDGQTGTQQQCSAGAC